jgi:hypothetical protein
MRRGLQRSYATLAYNCLEGVIAILAGLAAGSIARVGIGADSLIEVTASLTASSPGLCLQPIQRGSARRLARRALALSTLGCNSGSQPFQS